VAQKTLTPLQSRARNLELEIQSTSEKIRLTDQQLYSGKVRNPKELQEMQQEIQSLKIATANSKMCCSTPC
jgi:predicted  nucleic acid-binding Zn-ribbon protein